MKSPSSQVPTVFLSFLEGEKTMKQVSEETGIMRPNICRYIAKWQEADPPKIAVVRKGCCPVTHDCNVNFYTTDPERVEEILNQPKKQYEIPFDEEENN